ncbi:GTP 3',8-cyclase MoaA [Pelagimonas varians]|uniref:GTP 3',8-cyclase n=1 Tax=Pelagimonas varians TaxID=696760 RepID=A0A238L7X0_9RHOB|nr:GTP 3',8-cyclase MoaA [Pelagimonas varians]PYG25455.1 cyclic pyranopterin monophosphate synthase subunit MoaA [Pelagimonas varians]SMX50472.1 Cyclic pyranopterin monophosphate synthase [Pelagimonas varians]
MPLDTAPAPLLDSFGRTVSYLRLSVTDRCDIRCTYCMAEKMAFLPKRDVLSLEELAKLSDVFIHRGVRKLRLTGGEPLVRRDVMDLFKHLSKHLKSGALDELTLTTNGTLLAKYAETLAACGVKRVNVSLDTLDPQRYRDVTRIGDISMVLAGIDAAIAAGLQVKLNAVASRGVFEYEVDALIAFAHKRGAALTLIEEMPLGDTGLDRSQSVLSLRDLQADLAKRWTLTPQRHSSGGPARYMRVEQTGGHLGFISPMSCNFCALCNRVRVSCTGQLYTCMGDEGAVDLRGPLRHSEAAVERAIRAALDAKPERHNFALDRMAEPAVTRHMSALGG